MDNSVNFVLISVISFILINYFISPTKNLFREVLTIPKDKKYKMELSRLISQHRSNLFKSYVIRSIIFGVGLYFYISWNKSMTPTIKEDSEVSLDRRFF